MKWERWGEEARDPPSLRNWQRPRQGAFPGRSGVQLGHTNSGLGRRGKVSCKTPSVAASLSHVPDASGGPKSGAAGSKLPG